jgi:hypothetical protein
MPPLDAQMVAHVSKPHPRPIARSLRTSCSHDGPTASQRLPPNDARHRAPSKAQLHTPPLRLVMSRQYWRLTSLTV